MAASIDLKRLEYFIRVAELGSLSAAALSLHIAQPALGRQIRLLEEHIGARLFSRHRRGMQLTPAGVMLHRGVVDPLGQIETVVGELKAQSAGLSGRVVMGMPPSVSYALAAGLSLRLSKQSTHMSLRIVEGSSEQLIKWLSRGRITAGVLYEPSIDTSIVLEELLVEDLLLVSPPADSLGPDESLPFSQVKDIPLILPTSRQDLRVIVERSAANDDIDLNVKFESDSLIVIKQLVQSGICHTILPMSAIKGDVEAGRLRYARFEKPLQRRLALASPAVRDRSRETRALLRSVREEVQHLVKAGRWDAQLSDRTSA